MSFFTPVLLLITPSCSRRRTYTPDYSVFLISYTAEVSLLLRIKSKKVDVTAQIEVVTAHTSTAIEHIEAVTAHINLFQDPATSVENGETLFH